jgi:hypothetical protein
MAELYQVRYRPRRFRFTDAVGTVLIAAPKILETSFLMEHRNSSR